MFSSSAPPGNALAKRETIVTEKEPTLPDFESFEPLLRKHGTVSVVRGIRADWLTPSTAFTMLDGRVLLESAEGERDRDRYSFIGFDPIGKVELAGETVRTTFFSHAIEEPLGDRDPLDILDAYQKERILPVYPAPVPVPCGGIGYLAYEVIQRFEKVKLREKPDPLELPEVLFHFYGGFVIFDRLTQSQRLVVNAFRDHPDTGGDPRAEYDRVTARLDELETLLLETRPSIPSRPDEARMRAGELRFEIPRREFLEAVEKIREEIISGEILQAVLAQGIQAAWTGTGFEAYRKLRSINPSPYMFFLAFDDFDLFGASPEVMVRLRDGKLLLKPIAGTRRRPDDARREPAVAKELLEDEKERAEHLMLVDLGRNDLGRVAKTGSVLVTRQMFVERFSHVLHLVSEVQADLEDGMDAFDAIRATFPAGTVSGAPKLRAMEIVDEVEKYRRGPYAGLVGYFDGLGNFDSCITIRSAVKKGDHLHVRVGAGVVYDSIPSREFDETINKAGALLAAIGGQAPQLPKESQKAEPGT